MKSNPLAKPLPKYWVRVVYSKQFFQIIWYKYNYLTWYSYLVNFQTCGWNWRKNSLQFCILLLLEQDWVMVQMCTVFAIFLLWKWFISGIFRALENYLALAHHTQKLWSCSKHVIACENKHHVFVSQLIAHNTSFHQDFQCIHI